MVADQVARVVGSVGHHDRHSVALEAVEPRAHGEAEAAAEGRGEQAHMIELGDEGLDDRAGAIPAVVVDHEHLVVDARRFQRGDHVADGRADRALLVPGRDDHREPHAAAPQRSAFSSWISRRMPRRSYSSSQSG